MNDILSTPIEYLKGVGPQRGALLRKELNIHHFADLLHFFPYKYIDKTRYYKIRDLHPSLAEVQIVGKILGFKTIDQKRGQRLQAIFADETGEIELVWFQGIKWVKPLLVVGESYVVFGKVTPFMGSFSMAHPEMELLSEHKTTLKPGLLGMYSSGEKLSQNGLSSKGISKLVMQCLTESVQHIGESLPTYLLNELNLLSKVEAIINIHMPKTPEAMWAASFRLKFEELFWIQLQLITKNIIRKHKIKGHPFTQIGTYFNEFYHKHLPFSLTNAQKRVIKEIRKDLGSQAQMNRLLQGDVGSGKTIVAFLSMLMALDNGFQSCLMAPTEILATQHYRSIAELAEKMNIEVALLTGSTKVSERRRIHEGLLNGNISIIIGTHALLEDKVQFHNLGLAVIDEQHRFGVEQRSKLWKKNTIPPHVLVMTATPIPRTLAMSVYGDLDVSVIDELPPGRKPIQTVHRFDSNRLRVWGFLKEQIAQGRQVYIVYPLIEESEKLDYKDLMDGYESVSRDFPLPQYAISIVHGRMKPEEKESEMKRFLKGQTQIMVATTVIEVGVNVPNASVMVIESAERFGLSQLHQLRGRVGRGSDQSYCILMTGHKLSEDSKTRIETMCRTNDGFEISEVDLKLRGPGDIMGTQQSGILDLKIADIVKDQDILTLARTKAFEILQTDPGLQLPENQILLKGYTALTQKKSIWNYIS